jgi:hypothetical protein
MMFWRVAEMMMVVVARSASLPDAPTLIARQFVRMCEPSAFNENAYSVLGLLFIARTTRQWWRTAAMGAQNAFVEPLSIALASSATGYREAIESGGVRTEARFSLPSLASVAPLES